MKNLPWAIEAANASKSSCFGANAECELSLKSFEFPSSTNFTLNLLTSFVDINDILKIEQIGA